MGGEPCFMTELKVLGAAAMPASVGAQYAYDEPYGDERRGEAQTPAAECPAAWDPCRWKEMVADHRRSVDDTHDQAVHDAVKTRQRHLEPTSSTPMRACSLPPAQQVRRLTGQVQSTFAECYSALPPRSSSSCFFSCSTDPTRTGRMFIRLALPREHAFGW